MMPIVGLSFEEQEAKEKSISASMEAARTRDIIFFMVKIPFRYLDYFVKVYKEKFTFRHREERINIPSFLSK